MTNWTAVIAAGTAAGATFFGALLSGVPLQTSAEFAGFAFFSGMGGSALHYIAQNGGGGIAPPSK